MKVKTNNEPTFQPIELTITIETPEELNELYARINAPICRIENHIYRGASKKYDMRDFVIQPLFSKLQDLCKNNL